MKIDLTYNVKDKRYTFSGIKKAQRSYSKSKTFTVGSLRAIENGDESSEDEQEDDYETDVEADTDESELD